jgi:hypothetical protein
MLLKAHQLRENRKVPQAQVPTSVRFSRPLKRHGPLDMA